MATIKKLLGEGRITVNGQKIPAEVHYYDVPEVIALADDEPAIRARGGRLVIEGDANFLANWFCQMVGAECVLHLKDGRHVKFSHEGNFSYGDTVLNIPIELISSIES
jgi:hypothetical protein